MKTKKRHPAILFVFKFIIYFIEIIMFSKKCLHLSLIRIIHFRKNEDQTEVTTFYFMYFLFIQYFQ